MTDLAHDLYQRSVENAAQDYERAIDSLRANVDRLGDNPSPGQLANMVRDAGEVAAFGGRLHALREVAYLTRAAVDRHELDYHEES